MTPPSVLRVVVPLMLFIGSAAQAAETPRRFDIPAGPLDRALPVLARQGGIDIGGTESGLAQVQVPALRATVSVAAALRRLLRDTPFTAVPVDRVSYRIVRRPAMVRSRPRPVPIVPHERAEDAASGEVVVTASKTGTRLLRFPGSVAILPRDGGDDIGARAGPGLSEIAQGIPILQGTSMGAGRDKIFVRGVADSSFIGPTQSTATVYFGDVQLGYNGPDPSLSLYDVEKIEILEGPQGTLYGAGSIGGIIRLSPRAPDPSDYGGHVTAGVAATQHGAASYDLAGMVNAPIVKDIAGVRAVAYRKRDGGYVDDLRRGLSNVNRTITEGGRLALRVTPGGDWTIDTGLVVQSISARDSQYAQRGVSGIARQSAIAQPFQQDYRLARMVIEKRWANGLRLLAAAGLVDHNAGDRYDATRRGGPTLAYDTQNRSRLATQEIRLSRSRADGGGWLVGASLLHSRDIFTRDFGPIASQRDIVGVTNRANTAALFGEATLALSPRLSLTGGGRLTRARIDGEPIASRRNDQFLRGRTSERFDPTVATSYLIAPTLAVFARYQSGFRTGGIAVAPGIGRVADFDADEIHVVEVGIRKDRAGPRGVALSASLSYADWDRIQADLVNASGFPFTANIGTARIRGAELTGSWVPLPGLRADVAMFLNDGRITDPAANLPRTRGSRMPDSPVVSASGRLRYRWFQRGNDEWNVQADGRYVGRSMLGTQSPLDLVQRGYAAMDLGLLWRHRPFEFSASLDNVFDTRGNRFSSGNPFGLTARDQYTPARPRTLRLGFAVPLGQAR